MERLGTMEQSQPHGWGRQGVTAWPGSELEVCVGEPPPALAFPGTDSAALSSFGRDGSFAAYAGKRAVPRADSCRLAGNTHGACPQRPWADSGTVRPSGASWGWRAPRPAQAHRALS